MEVKDEMRKKKRPPMAQLTVFYPPVGPGGAELWRRDLRLRPRCARTGEAKAKG